MVKGCGSHGWSQTHRDLGLITLVLGATTLEVLAMVNKYQAPRFIKYNLIQTMQMQEDALYPVQIGANLRTACVGQAKLKEQAKLDSKTAIAKARVANSQK